TGHTLVWVSHVKHVAGQGRQLDERRAGIEHQRDALARQELPALVEAVFRGGGGHARTLLQSAHPLNQRQHALAIGPEVVAAGRDGVFDDGHALSYSSLRGTERRSNPLCFRGCILDCFASLAMTVGTISSASSRRSCALPQGSRSRA